jgi:hypothetical protein
MQPRIATVLAAVAPLCTAQVPFVNVPVAPEAIYIGRTGAQAGVSVIDCNGFGQGTGNINATRFPLNPNIGLPGVFPPLAPGTSNVDAGSAGALTLASDSLLNSNLLPAAAGISDIAIGMPLDILFNNLAINRNVATTNQVNPATGQPMGLGNTIAVAPHPNPPRLVFPSPNPSRGIDTEEPTVTSSFGPPGRVLTTSPPCLASPLNVLVPGNPFASTPGALGLFGANFSGVFYGPQPPPPSPPPPTPFCPYTSRQQIGHFLFVADRPANRVLVVDSNRFRVLTSIGIPDPTRLAMHPSLRLLAVTSAATGNVYVVHTDAFSPTFGMVLGSLALGPGVAGCAWQPEGEDLFVCNPVTGNVSIVSGSTFAERERLVRPVRSPLDVAVTMRHLQTEYRTKTYFAFLLATDGTLAVYESAPPVPGSSSRVLLTQSKFARARAIQPDLSQLATACWIAHQDDLGLGRVSRVALTSASGGSAIDAAVREFTVTMRIGGVQPPPTTPVRDLFSGNVLGDLAFDDIVNAGAFPDVPPAAGGLPPARHSGKGQAKVAPGGVLLATRSPMLLFAACIDVGKVDVLEAATGRRIASIDVPGVAVLADYWRQ